MHNKKYTSIHTYIQQYAFGAEIIIFHTYLLKGLGFCLRLVDRPRVAGFQPSSCSSSGSSRFKDALGRREYFSCAFSANGNALLLFASNSAISTRARERRFFFSFILSQTRNENGWFFNGVEKKLKQYR